jgi:hypothetical protein
VHVVKKWQLERSLVASSVETGSRDLKAINTFLSGIVAHLEQEGVPVAQVCLHNDSGGGSVDL